jgi:hypothetical protein
LPQTGFLFSIAGLSVTLVGFSGLVAALRRDTPKTALQGYRVRQIPEMALISALVALITLPLADSTSDDAVAIRIASAVALALTVGHVVVALVSATVWSFEWLMVVLIARPAVAFVMALTDPTDA